MKWSTKMNAFKLTNESVLLVWYNNLSESGLKCSASLKQTNKVCTEEEAVHFKRPQADYHKKWQKIPKF